MQRDPALLTHATFPSAEAKWELARTSPDSPLPGKQQRVGHLFGHPLDVLQEDAPLPRGLAHVLAVVLRDEGGVGNHVLRRPFTPTPDPLALVILTVRNLLVLWTAWLPERNRGMDSGTFNRSAERKYSAGWTAVPICDIGAAERA